MLCYYVKNVSFFSVFLIPTHHQTEKWQDTKRVPVNQRAELPLTAST